VILGVKSSFMGAHNLINYNGKCSRKHGHEWKYEIKIRKRINPDTGMAVDFKDIKKCLNDYVDEILDHSDLNEVLPFNPSAENIAVWIFETLSKKALLKGIISVTIWETENSSVEITAKDMLEIEKQNEIKKKG
jgi:6-pyruvoyltetrahydropterin/6-carboxytetrahydropterin synthase